MEIAYTAPFSGFLRQRDREGVVLLNEDGKILSANRAAESLLGYEAGQLTNLHITDFWKGSYPAARALPERPRPQDIELTRRNGESLPVTAAITPLHDVSETERLMSFVSRSEIERLNEALLRAQRLAGVGTLTASVAHELTNPISIITASCANLVDELNDNTISREELVQAIGLIEQSAFRCARIVDMLRNYAHNTGHEDAAGEDGAIAITSPAAILQDALTMVEQQFRKQARVAIAVDVQPELTTIFCDHHRIAQVVINLLLNARDAMQPAGGTVHVKFWVPDVERDLPQSLRLRPAMSDAGSNNDLFAISITDSGTGIAPEHMANLFEPFFTTKPNGQGTGLGLFIAAEIIAQHGGQIFAQNNPTGGATFTVILPRKH